MNNKKMLKNVIENWKFFENDPWRRSLMRYKYKYKLYCATDVFLATVDVV